MKPTISKLLNDLWLLSPTEPTSRQQSAGCISLKLGKPNYLDLEGPVKKSLKDDENISRKERGKANVTRGIYMIKGVQAWDLTSHRVRVGLGSWTEKRLWWTLNVTLCNLSLILGAIRSFWKEKTSSVLCFSKCCVWIKVGSKGIREAASEVESIKNHLVFFYTNMLKYTLKHTNILKSWERKAKSYLSLDWKWK